MTNGTNDQAPKETVECSHGSKGPAERLGETGTLSAQPTPEGISAEDLDARQAAKGLQRKSGPLLEESSEESAPGTLAAGDAAPPAEAVPPTDVEE
ncbi:MAG: hypothetical protein QNJ45_13440 [Ardenticatenaceae bacterium]|nr:hypothetical protein [Ardenticatenaceae bacterium]